jgi:hypothetical protein
MPLTATPHSCLLISRFSIAHMKDTRTSVVGVKRPQIMCANRALKDMRQQNGGCTKLAFTFRSDNN